MMNAHDCDTCAWSEDYGPTLGDPANGIPPESGYHVCIFDRSIILLDSDAGEDQPCWMPPIDTTLDDIINMEDVND